MRTLLNRFIVSLCGVGLVLGTLFMAASLTPTLVPRGPLMQGALSGVCFAAGYGLGVQLRNLWRALGWPTAEGRFKQISLTAVLAVCAISTVLALWWATSWQNRLRALMDMPAIDTAGPFTIAVAAAAAFSVLLLLVRLFRLTRKHLARRIPQRIPTQTTTVLAVVITALLFWNLGNGLLVHGALRLLDSTYAELDARLEDGYPRPTGTLQTGGPDSLVSWPSLGRQGRRMVANEPTQAQIEQLTGRAAKEPLRVYVGLASAASPQERAQLALKELQRIGAFKRTNLVIATPTGTGWVDPEGQQAMEYVLQGDVATVSVQYSYFASWLALLADPEYGTETARAVFATVYDHWRQLPRDARPRLYLNGLSLGALNSDLSHDLHQVIGDPYDGALWAGPPFNTPTWRTITAARNVGSPAWLPTFRDGSAVRFTAQRNHLDKATAPWGPHRVIFLQYASDAVTFFDPNAWRRKPEWMAEPRGPDVSPDLVWIPIVSFLQLSFDIMVAVSPPTGFGHTYAFDHYVEAWASLTGPAHWTSESLAALKQRFAEHRKAREAADGTAP